jgi:hypothetical protein
MTSGWVGLPQVGKIVVSECVALGLPSPGVVVTWLVTVLRISVRTGVGQGRILSTMNPMVPEPTVGERQRIQPRLFGRGAKRQRLTVAGLTLEAGGLQMTGQQLTDDLGRRVTCHR